LEKDRAELEALQAAQVHLSAPTQIELLKDAMKTFLGQFKKLPNQNKRGFLERFFQKIVIKSSGVIELHIFEDVFKGQLGKNITTSSTYGKSGGTNRTWASFTHFTFVHYTPVQSLIRPSCPDSSRRMLSHPPPVVIPFKSLMAHKQIQIKIKRPSSLSFGRPVIILI
jgi:hypothetical protein